MGIFGRRKILKKAGQGIALIIVCALVLTGCGSGRKGNAQDVLTQKPKDDNKTQITVLVKYAFSINTFERVVERRFPDIDIVQVGNYTRDMGIDEYNTRLENKDLTDVVMTWPLEVGQEYWDENLMDLSGLDFTNKYNVSILNEISKDGKLYYLPGPSQVRGIVYNKTLFNENGWKVPENFEDFISLCKTIEKSGMRSLQLGFSDKEVLDTAFTGFSLGDCYSKPQDAKWISDYNNGQNSFGDHFIPAFNTFERLINEGVFKKDDLNVGYADRERMLFSRECAMVEDSVLLARMGEFTAVSKDEFALMPFFNPGSNSDWARLYMVCYIGVNKNLLQAENSGKYQAVIKLMEYISTKEGQEAFMGDTGAMFSNLKGMPTPNIPEIQDMHSALESGRYAVFTPLKNAQSALREGLAGMLRGKITREQVIQSIDEQNISAPKENKVPSTGKANDNFTLIETGNFITDAMRDYSGCEIALFLDNGKDGRFNGKGVSGKLYKGELDATDIDRILPDLKLNEKGTLWKITMTGADLKNTLEHSITIGNDMGGWFYYFSGLKMEYNPTANPGSRIKNIVTRDGRGIDDNREYTIAVMDESVPNRFIKTKEDTNVTISSILNDAIRTENGIAPSKDGRFKVWE